MNRYLPINTNYKISKNTFTEKKRGETFLKKNTPVGLNVVYMHHAFNTDTKLEIVFNVFCPFYNADKKDDFIQNLPQIDEKVQQEYRDLIELSLSNVQNDMSEFYKKIGLNILFFDKCFASKVNFSCEFRLVPLDCIMNKNCLKNIKCQPPSIEKKNTETIDIPQYCPAEIDQTNKIFWPRTVAGTSASGFCTDPTFDHMIGQSGNSRMCDKTGQGYMYPGKWSNVPSDLKCVAKFPIPIPITKDVLDIVVFKNSFDFQNTIFVCSEVFIKPQITNVIKSNIEKSNKKFQDHIMNHLSIITKHSDFKDVTMENVFNFQNTLKFQFNLTNL